MKLFISWSGPLSKKIAYVLQKWIPRVIQNVEPYVSSENIDKGSRWSIDIAKELQGSVYGILCVTKDNYKAPWLNFEAGALSKELDISRVCPFLYNIKLSEIEGPLLQFQATVFDKEDIYRLMSNINKWSNEHQLTEETLKETFELWWPKLEQQLNFEDIDITQEDNDTDFDNAKNTKILEEILSLVQTQQRILRRPEEILPPDYLRSVIERPISLDRPNSSSISKINAIFGQTNKKISDIILSEAITEEKIYPFIVTIEGTDGNKNHFNEMIVVKAKNEADAERNAQELFMIPGPQGLSHKFDNGPNAVTHWVRNITRLN